MNCLSKNIVQLLDLPDELILAIMNKIKPGVLMLCSIIGIENNRLEQLALDECHSIDLTYDYFQSSYESLFKRFYSHVMPRISNNIQSLTLDVLHLSDIITFAEKTCNEILQNLTYLKIAYGRICLKTGTSYTLGDNMYSVLHCHPLFSIIPQLFAMDDPICHQIFSIFRCSPLMRSIVSFELDDNCILFGGFNDDELFFPQSIQLTHIRITLYQFEQCVRLLYQLGSQLYSFSVSFMFVDFSKIDILSEIALISCPCLKQLTVTNYRNIMLYEEYIVPLLQRLSNVQYLTLLLAIGVAPNIPNHFIDGYDLEEHIVLYMPHLRQFNFHVRSILKDAPHIENDIIRQSFMKQQQQSFDCVVDYFNNNYGQCQIYSLPFIGTRLDFISNRFPLFDINNTFSMVTMLLLFDDVKPFESIFFARVARALPRLKTLEIFNRLEQEEKTTVMTTNLEFVHLSTLILFHIHIDYAEQFLCRTYLPYLIELAIHSDILLAIIAQDQQQARDNCSRVERLHTSEPSYDSVDVFLNFFPPGSYVKHPEDK